MRVPIRFDLIVFVAVFFALTGFGCSSAKAEEKNETDYQAEFARLFSAQNFDELPELLQMWEQSEPDNPEMFIAYFNYYINKERSSRISIDPYRSSTGRSMPYTDPSTNQVVGFLNEHIEYNIEDVQTGLGYLTKGLIISPARLDMHFGKIKMLNEIGRYAEAESELMTLLDTSKIINNDWLWSNNRTVEDGEDFFLNNVMDYYSFWLNSDSKEVHLHAKTALEKNIELYPEFVPVHNTLGIYYAMNGLYEDALRYLLKAEELDPADTLVLTNIGRIYAELNEKAKATQYFQRVLDNEPAQQERNMALHYLMYIL